MCIRDRYLLTQSRQVTILGKTYKPGVALTTGSYSLLVAETLRSLGGEVEFYDPMMGERKHDFRSPHVYLISHWQDWIGDFSFVPGSTVVDPWRKMPHHESLRVVHYGNTRHQR